MEMWEDMTFGVLCRRGNMGGGRRGGGAAERRNKGNGG